MTQKDSEPRYTEAGIATFIEKGGMEDIDDIFTFLKSRYPDTYQGVTPELTREIVSSHAESEDYRIRATAGFKEYLSNADKGAIFVARRGREVVGYSTAFIDAEGKHWMRDLYTFPQGIGTGRKLLGAVLDWHQQHQSRGDNDIYLWVAPKTRAVRFYFHQGFRLSGEYGGSTWESGKHLPLIEMRLPVLKTR